MTLEFFNDDELAQMRTDVANAMPDTAYILRTTAGTGLYGGFEGTQGTVGTITARIDRLTRTDSTGMIAETEVGRTYYQATFPYNADVRDGDDIKVGGRVFRVLQMSRSQSANIVRRAVVGAQDEGNE